jgi:Glyoxalase-like domain
MAFDVQVAIDCSAPHDLADWWAEVLGWQVEPQDEAFIRRMIEVGAASEEDTARHKGALVWKEGAAIRSPDPDRPRLLFQQVPEAKTVKNRVHLDVRVGADRREAEVARLLGMGATELWRASQGPYEWATLADPEGNEFCVT